MNEKPYQQRYFANKSSLELSYGLIPVAFQKDRLKSKGQEQPAGVLN
jgi:hypothetical protein